MACNFLKIIMKKSSCCYALFVGNCHSTPGSEVIEIVAAVQVKETKCSEENNTNITNISSALRMQFVVLLMLYFDVRECRSWFRLLFFFLKQLTQMCYNSVSFS